MILDPADPTWDVGNGAACNWNLLAQEAESCYDLPCFLQAAGGAVEPWKVPVSEGASGILGFYRHLHTFLCSSTEHLLCTRSIGVWNRLKKMGTAGM